jgi:hypothetical protein
MKAHCRVGHDPALAAEHPDWRQQNSDGNPRATLCLNTSYVAKAIWPWMIKAASAPDCDALECELDASTTEPCWCDACTQHLRDAGFALDEMAPRQQLARASLQRFKDETRSYAEAIRPGIQVVFHD